MAVTDLTTGIKDLAAMGRYPAQPLVADSLDVAFQAPAVAADGVRFASTGREIILVQNTDVGAQTFTVASTRTEYGHVQNITTYSLAAGEFAALPLGADKLYKDATGYITITASNVAIKVAVLRGINIV